MSFRLRYIGGVDARLKSEIVELGKWLRKWYPFPITLEIRLVNEKVLIDLDGAKCHLRYWQSSRGAEPVTGLIAVGSFAQTLKSRGPTWAYPTVVAAVGRVLKYYNQMIRDAPLREDYATRWGDRLLDAYVEETTPPPPWKGAWSE